VQALKTETIPFLVGLLETGLEAVDNMAATKAQIVKALKAMQLSLKYGDQVTLFFFCQFLGYYEQWLLMATVIYHSNSIS